MRKFDFALGSNILNAPRSTLVDELVIKVLSSREFHFSEYGIAVFAFRVIGCNFISARRNRHSAASGGIYEDSSSA